MIQGRSTFRHRRLDSASALVPDVRNRDKLAHDIGLRRFGRRSSRRRVGPDVLEPIDVAVILDPPDKRWHIGGHAI